MKGVDVLLCNDVLLKRVHFARADTRGNIMRTVAIINQKGGCGKTTVSINLASVLALKGYRTLLVDMDSQSHCAVGLAVPEEQIEQSIYDVLISHSRGEPLRLSEIMWKISDCFELAPASIDLAAFEQQMSGVVDGEGVLRNVLKTVKREYDYVIVDCPPAVGLLTFNAIRAATDVIVPVETGYFSLHGLSKQLSTLNVLCEQCAQSINVMVLASMYDIRTKMGREILGELRRHFGERMFTTIVNFNTKLKEAASLGQPVSEFDPASKGHKDFEALVDELVGTDTQMHRIEVVDVLQSRIEAISASAEELLSAVKPIETAKPIETVKPAAVIKPVEIIKPVEVAAPIEEIKPVVVSEVAEIAEPIEVSEPATVAEPVAVAEAVIEEPVAEVKSRSLDEKLADFYGVRQVGDAIMFAFLYPRAERVELAGDFNNWQPSQTPLEKMNESGMWQIKLPMGKGRYRYRLVVDGRWQQDPYNEMTEVNPYGECNSVVEVC